MVRFLPQLLLLFAPTLADACTAYIAGKDATIDGSVMVSHSDDGAGSTDARVSYIPAADHEPGSKRPILPDTDDYPRYVGTARGGSTYTPLPGQSPTQPIGHIPQVAHTFAYFESGYAIQNECNVMIGESTVAPIFGGGVSVGQGGKSLLSVTEMTRIALERTCTAREAVALMGELAVKYGFYGADGGAGESLMVGDASEGWVFHVLSDPSGASALWAAQRVPDDHVSVVANMFTIREIDLSDSAHFLGSGNLHDVAKEHKLWDGRGRLDFTAAFSRESRGEYGSMYGAGRRIWDFYRRVSPSLKLPAEYDNLKTSPVYPWSAKPDRKIAPSDLFEAYRSHFEGTPFDTTKGLAAGPFGTPDRYATVGVQGDPGVGNWERTVSIFRSSHTVVATANAALPKEVAGTMWYGPADSSKTVFVPMMVAMGEPPREYVLGRQADIDRNSAYWAHRYVQNLAQIRYSAMIEDIRASSKAWEARGAALVEQIVQAVTRSPSGASRIKPLLDAHSAEVLAATWKLADDLMVKYADGYLTLPQKDGSTVSKPLGYPTQWLEAVGFTEGNERLPGPVGDALPGGKPDGKVALATEKAKLASETASSRGDLVARLRAEAAKREDLVRKLEAEVARREAQAAQLAGEATKRAAGLAKKLEEAAGRRGWDASTLLDRLLAQDVQSLIDPASLIALPDQIAPSDSTPPADAASKPFSWAFALFAALCIAAAAVVAGLLVRRHRRAAGQDAPWPSAGGLDQGLTADEERDSHSLGRRSRASAMAAACLGALAPVAFLQKLRGGSSMADKDAAQPLPVLLEQGHAGDEVEYRPM